MQTDGPKLLLSTSPFLKHREDAAWIMWQVNYSLVPVVLAAVYVFGLSAVLVIVSSVLGALTAEGLAGYLQTGRMRSLKDGSALITGVLLALTLPPGIPIWMAFVGGLAAILLGKVIFGGIGASIFNPALVGRAFLQASFPVALTTWSVPRAGGSFFSLSGDNLAEPFLQPTVDGISAATPLARMKFDAEPTAVADLLLGNTGGSLGETSALIILLCGLYMAFRRVLNWRIPVSILSTVFVLGGVLYLTDPATYPTPVFHLFSGGLMLGAVFMATDPVTSPVTMRGCWVFGIAIGILVVVIRQFGGLPEGVMFAILLMNACTPLINRFTQPRVYGTPKSELWRSN